MTPGFVSLGNAQCSPGDAIFSGQLCLGNFAPKRPNPPHRFGGQFGAMLLFALRDLTLCRGYPFVFRNGQPFKIRNRVIRSIAVLVVHLKSLKASLWACEENEGNEPMNIIAAWFLRMRQGNPRISMFQPWLQDMARASALRWKKTPHATPSGNLIVGFVVGDRTPFFGDDKLKLHRENSFLGAMRQAAPSGAAAIDYSTQWGKK